MIDSALGVVVFAPAFQGRRADLDAKGPIRPDIGLLQFQIDFFKNDVIKPDAALGVFDAEQELPAVVALGNLKVTEPFLPAVLQGNDFLAHGEGRGDNFPGFLLGLSRHSEINPVGDGAIADAGRFAHQDGNRKKSLGRKHFG